MNNWLRLTIVLACAFLCAGGILVAHAHRPVQPGVEQFALTGAAPNEYLRASRDLPPALSLNDIERIVRRDPLTKEHRGKMEFGSVRLEQELVVAQIVFREPGGAVQEFICKLGQQDAAWHVVSAQRLWFVRATHTARGLRI